ncbi:Ribosomal RNA-processing protein 8 [Nosema granulosis]|uniref:Ribosomal RNA-processing protein 8 n=1 Tax=Nosema granulosis TaxID=83296 RepID=A0A9P6H235_9MICR|nr:Ribosomal RNA-processing protein 8 [Nosema granulosis]
MGLKEELEKRLIGSKFRVLNEKLYKNKKLTKEEIKLYHECYAQQVKKWPVNPLDLVIKRIQETSPSAVVADLGCGSAKIAQTFTNVHSFDAFPTTENITKCDMENVPLENSSVDIAVCCLSLMKQDITKTIKEVSRILKKNGLFYLAEIRSRVVSVNKFCCKLEDYGFEIANCDTSNSHFIFIELKKKKEINQEIATKITLKPCFYKKR